MVNLLLVPGRLNCFRRAFTLIELLIVLVIISIVLGLSVLAIRPNALKKRQGALHQLCQELQQVSIDAIMAGQTKYLVLQGFSIYTDNWANSIGYFDAQYQEERLNLKFLFPKDDGLIEPPFEKKSIVAFYSDGTSDRLQFSLKFKNKIYFFSIDSVGRVICDIE